MYKPDRKILNNYARVLINFALGSGKGIKKDQVVLLQFDLPALSLALEVYQTILKSGGHPIVRPSEENFEKIFFNLANESQLKFFPKKYSKALIDTIDHRIYVLANRDPLLLKSTDPKKIIIANQSKKLMRVWMNQKEDSGKFTWTLALYGTQGLADQAGLSLSDYWQQIIRACFLDDKNPIKTWQKITKDLETIKKKLTDLPIDRLHIQAKNTDLIIGLGERRKWMGGSGRNIPSFELFTSPNWRQTNGEVFFDYPLYRYGNIIKNIYLEFKNGKVTKAKAEQNEKLLLEMIKQKNADKIGEFSLTDIRFSHISKFMALTLYDENYGGQYGNTHLALGTSYHDAYTGEIKKMKAKDWEKLGFNESVEHCDIIAKSDRIVTAFLKSGIKKVIYEKGKFII